MREPDRIRRLLYALPALLLCTLPPAPARAQEAAPGARVDSVFARWNSPEMPGCAVGVARDGRTVFERAYGMADLEHDVPNTARTVFESGSVAKQFTAAAIVLLAEDGLLSLDDDVRRYVPELPVYEQPITLRHLVTHTSGLRDWGSVAAIAGWPRSQRTHTHAHVLDILSRQRELNFPPGSAYSYSNSGFNLLAIIAERVSGVSLDELSRTRIFAPLGMASTQWRDDYRELVEDRATAYTMQDDVVLIDRPIENVYGNGGLLTTVGDLLRWNQALHAGRVGGPAFASTMQQRGVLTSGDTIEYATGLFVTTYRGLPEVSHTGSTSGYRAFLARYPTEHLDVALLCNVGAVNPGRGGRRVAGAIRRTPPPLADHDRAADDDDDARAPYAPAPDRIASVVGRYHSEEADVTWRIERDGDRLVLRIGPGLETPLRPVAADEFASRAGRIRFVRDAAGSVTELRLRDPRVHDLVFRRLPD